MKTRDILNILNQIAPFGLAEKWDNSGLQAGHPEWDVNKMIIGLDVSLGLMNEAVQTNSNLVLTHHPLMIAPEKNFDFEKMPGKAIYLAAKHQISIISAHTNLDKADQGLNDYFASKLHLLPTTVFVPDEPENDSQGPVTGIGRMGTLKDRLSVRALAGRIKEELSLSGIRAIGDLDQKADTIAICTGSGGSLVDKFIGSDANVFITGDIKYHEARAVEEASKAVIDVGHFGSEHMAIELLSTQLTDRVQKAGLNLEIIEFLKEKDPFTIV